ncbi:MAG TPA: ATP-binding protein, partial [Crinalium sp.]
NGHLTDPTAIHYLQILQDSSHQMGLLIDGLLTLSRVGRRQMAATPVNLNRLVANVLAQLPQNHPASDTAITDDDPIQFIIGDLPTVKGDATLLHQVFVNLLDNAIKFSRPHPAPIEVAALADGTIFVRDRGVGFQMEDADQLFGAFQRLHSRSEFEGTGIGLAIVQRIIHRHDGTIWVESQPGQGATFYFKLGDQPSTP